MSVTINGSAGVTTNSGAVYDSLQTGTAKAYNWNGLTTNTYIDFTGIPSWVKRITVMLNGVSVSGTSVILIQLGDSGGVEITGYLSVGSRVAGSTAASTGYTTGFGLASANAATSVYSGSIILTLVDSSNTWVANGVVADTAATYTTFTSGTKQASATLDRVRITTVNGTDTFDAGTINIIYE